MIVLGIHDGHNSSAALLADGRAVAAVQEERLSGAKNEARVPHLAIAEVLRIAGVTWGDVDAVALHSQHMPYARSRDDLYEHYRRVGKLSGRLRSVLRRTPMNYVFRQRRRAHRLAELREKGVPLDKIQVVDHHVA